MSAKPLVEIQHEGWNALIEKLSYRCITIYPDYDTDSRDYTKDKYPLLSDKPDEIIAPIMKPRKESE
ncbi:MAG: hypothetical protein GXY48_14385 [Methanomicrobiales archaeon]|nr:hypothetical protein [Methanomicrobiales archaeon]